MRILGILQAYIDSILQSCLISPCFVCHCHCHCHSFPVGPTYNKYKTNINRLSASLIQSQDSPSLTSVQPDQPHTDCSLIFSQQHRYRVATMSVPESKYLSAIWRDNIFSKLLRIEKRQNKRHVWLMQCLLAHRGQGHLRHRRRRHHLQHADQSNGPTRSERLYPRPKRQQNRGCGQRHCNSSAGRQGHWHWRMRRAQGKLDLALGPQTR